MPEARSNQTKTAATDKEPVVFVHATGGMSPDAAWFEQAGRSGAILYCHRQVKGCRKTAHGYEQLGLLLAELSAAHEGQSIMLLHACLDIDGNQLGQLARLENPAQAIIQTVLSNADPLFNPLAGLTGAATPPRAALANAISMMGSGKPLECRTWPAHLAVLSPPAVAALSEPGVTTANATSRLWAAGGIIEVDDRQFAYTADRSLFAAPVLEAHEQARPPAWGALSARLQQWLDQDCPELESIQDERPVTLHVSHSWGGGVAQWIRRFIDADRSGVHLQLLAEGPQSGQGTGQRLSVYAGNTLSVALSRYWLQPPIQSVQDHDPRYLDALNGICARYGVGRIIVSSLVGHCLDVFHTGLPTVQVLHDQFPLWPFLSENPEPFLGEGGADYDAALARFGARSEFAGLSKPFLGSIRDRYHEVTTDQKIRFAAPSRSVIRLRQALDPRWKAQHIELIPHGIESLEESAKIAAKPRHDGRLNIVIPGRMQAGKGQKLLLDALDALAPLAQITLLGCGKSGEAFLGHNGVNVIAEYRSENLPGLLEELGPELAVLLSVVPETFSYTLSEMRGLGIPVIATRLGSFNERIEDEKSGWLIDPTADALVGQVQKLAKDPGLIDRVRSTVGDAKEISPADMVSAYKRLCPAERRESAAQESSPDLWQAQAASMTWLETVERANHHRTNQSLAEARKEVKARTEWALDTQQALKEEQQRRIEWVSRLEREQERLQSIIGEQQSQLEENDRQFARLDNQLRQLRKDLDQLQETHQQVLASSSWRITRPFRVARRAGRNFMHSRAWNPLRWPLLLSGLARNLATTGLRGTLMRMQYQGYQAPAVEAQPEQAEPVGDPTPPARIPCAESPVASIVIPVYNQWAYTAACLRSLADARCDIRFEVIVVDDASSDGSFEHLAQVEGLTVIRNEQNAGFIDSCNRGAEQARGDYIVLLNNDTRVTDGWLDALVDTFREIPGAGLVGSRLVYPDGRLQECGGIVFADGSGWNYGKGDKPANPQYEYLRDVDYCSGASIMVDAALFRQLEGFDVRYRPAYYEDTDLAFRVRAAGRRVLVQPKSTVIHYEGVTSGTDTNSGVKQHQVSNRETFLQRWRSELEQYPQRIEDPSNPALIRKARDHGLRGRVLIIDATTPEPDQDSGSLRLTNIMRCFIELGYGVSFFAENHLHAGRYTRDLQSLGVETWYEPWLESNHDFLRRNGAEFNIVMVSRHYVASNYLSMVRKHCPDAAFVFDTVDLHYLREQRLAELEDSATLKAVARQTQRSEVSVINDSDATLVVSPAEVEVLAEDAPEAQVHVLSNVHELPGRQRGFDKRSDLFFVGGYQHPPNIDAMQWFVTEIWPIIHARLPEACFHMIGSKAPDEVRKLKGDGVYFHGFVQDLEQYLDGCRLAVAPLRYGAGVKGKVNMSMAHGQPVVATPVAIEGLHAEHERDVLVAETNQEFAEQVIRLYQDKALWNRLSEGGVENVRRHFSLDAARHSIEQLLEKLGLN